MMKKYNINLFVGTLFFLTHFLYADAALDYLNTLRTKAGLPMFSANTALYQAAQNHSDYLQEHNTTGHSEDSSLSGYTGNTIQERVTNTGYTHLFLGENVSSFSSGDYKRSIDNLFSAIYHRFAFLHLELDEIGIGISADATKYTYDLGNKALYTLCLQSNLTTTSYYQPCTDNSIRVDSQAYLNAFADIKAASDDLILWPAKQSDDIPPVFYEESPDPLPFHSVTGYPVSVEFNAKTFTIPPVVTSFTLEDENENLQNELIVMDENNDPNGHFSSYQHALFPERRLEWGSIYYANLDYSANGNSATERWCFQTQTLENKVDKVYRIEGDNNVTLTVVSGQTYALYVVPNNTNDTLGVFSVGYTSLPVYTRIDDNTLSVKLTDSIGRYAQFVFDNGQIVKLIIASSDSASLPKNVTCPSTTTSTTNSTRVQIEQFVTRFYQVILGRSPDSEGLSDWSSKLEGLSKSGADIAKGFIFSTEYDIDSKLDAEYLNTLYSAFFNRPPDNTGFGNWIDLMNSGMSREDVLNGFLNSLEFKNLADSYGIIANATPVELFVSRFYKQCLNRLPDTEGLSDWTERLNSGVASGSDVAFGFVFSDEFTGRNLNNTEFVTVLYRAFFGREPDTAGFNDWMAQLNAGTSREAVLQGFLGAAEFAALAASYGIRVQ